MSKNLVFESANLGPPKDEKCNVFSNVTYGNTSSKIRFCVVKVLAYYIQQRELLLDISYSIEILEVTLLLIYIFVMIKVQTQCIKLEENFSIH